VTIFKRISKQVKGKNQHVAEDNCQDVTANRKDVKKRERDIRFLN
jgi:hypothetical protein